MERTPSPPKWMGSRTVPRPTALPHVISTDPGLDPGRSPTSFRPEPCVSTAVPHVISTGAVRQHGGVEKPRPRGQGGFSTARLRRSGRNDEEGAGASAGFLRSSPDGSPHSSFRRTPDLIRGVAAHSTAPPTRHFDRSRASARRSGETSSPWGREVSPLRAPRSGRNDEGGSGWEVSPLRACGAPVEMTTWEARLRTAPPRIESGVRRNDEGGAPYIVWPIGLTTTSSGQALGAAAVACSTARATSAGWSGGWLRAA